MSFVKLPDIPISELAPRMRLAQKLRSAVAIKDKNDKAGKLYEIVVGYRLAQFGWLTGGYQIGRGSLSESESDQNVYYGGKEVDALIRKRLDRRWLINETKLSGGAGSQIKYAVESTLVSQVEAAKQGRTPELAGLVYAEGSKHLESVQREVADNVVNLLRGREFLASSRCTCDVLEQALDLNCRKVGIAASAGRSKLNEYLNKYQDFNVEAFRRAMFGDLEKLLGVTLLTINPRLIGDLPNGNNEERLRTLLAPELRTLEATPEPEA